MATYYIDPEWTGTRSGSFAQPYSAYSSVTNPQPGDRILQKAGTTFNGHVTPPSGKSGTPGSPITYGVYDATTGEQITTTVGSAAIAGIGSLAHVFSTGGESFIEIVGFRLSNITSSSYSGIRLGSNSTGNTDGNAARYCIVENETCYSALTIYANLGVTGHSVDHCQLNTNSQFGIAIEGSLLGAKVNITNNTCNYNGRSGIRNAFSTAINLSGSVANNTCNYNGTIQATPPYGIGIDLISNKSDLVIFGNTCNNNYINGMILGNFTGAAGTNQFVAQGNICCYSGESGITVSTGGGWIVSGNTCNYNGADRGNRYGRGIEVYGGSIKPAGPGIVCYNECSYNFNYGGTVNNGTEGVGIGLDDYHKDIQVRGNLIVGNEGNGIQWNPTGAAGSSKAFGNILIDNFAAPASRAASWANYVKAQMCTFTTESGVSIFNNNVILSAPASAPACLYGFSESNIAAGSGLAIQNNLFKGHSVGMKIRASAVRTNNGFHGNSKNVESNVNATTLPEGTDSIVAEPQLDPSYRPQAAAYKRAGVYLGGKDFRGKQFYNPPNIGAVDDVSVTPRYLFTDRKSA